MTSLIRWCGTALCAAAVLTLGINVFISPFLPKGAFSVVAASDIYVLRQILCSVTALLLVFGIMGLHLSRLGKVGVFGTIAFVIALSGAVGLFSLEYGQVFTVHDYALNAPQALDHTLAGAGPLAIGAMIVIGGFYFGWLLIAVSVLLTRDYPRLAGALILGGMIAAPLLHVTGKFDAYAGIVASLIIGSGWFTLGLRMFRGN